jgi:NCS1 family nucleobase:cation symporter-1
VRKRELVLADLYLTGGAYRYQGGWNFRAVVATLAGCGFAWVGVVVPALHTLYEYAWFVGFGVSMLVYLALTRLVPPEGYGDRGNLPT